jgi:inosine triphosphate pyrophosphatase
MTYNITFLTGSTDKFVEAQSVFGDDIAQLDIDLVEVQHIDPEVVISSKLSDAQKHASGTFIVEDTSLSLDCLGGLPGTLIKWFMKTIGNPGLVNLVEKLGNPSATARVIVGYSRDGAEPLFFEGSIQGTIVTPRGDNGFGWDPIFQPVGYDKTFAEMSAEEKNNISMRKIALQKLKDYLDTTLS